MREPVPESDGRPSGPGAVPAAGLVAEGLACRRGGRLVFCGLSFRLPPGGALVLTGPNGSGKSSLLRLLAGLAFQQAGTLSWNGLAVDDCREAYRRALAYVGHLDAVKPALTAHDNLAFWAALSSGKAVGDRVAAALAAFGLTALAGLPGRYLSAGQRRRLSLARLLLGEARLWLLDEPTVALDAASLSLLEAAIARHRAGGGLVVLATHVPPPLEAPVRLDLDDFAPRGEDAEWWGFQGVDADTA
ncbi:MAG: heme ABC exporter ATP-binding protein CcmA [Alphaproteobacteria bacterium]|nr:heme ABC exporter ATP-binding protein CcmA [Alphaproteobacteria bacterium]